MPDEHGRKIKCCWMQERAFDWVSSSGAVAWLPHIHASSCSSHVWGLSEDLTGMLLALLSPPAEGVLYWCILVGDMYESPVFSPRKGSFVCYYGRSSTIGKKKLQNFPCKVTCICILSTWMEDQEFKIILSFVSSSMLPKDTWDSTSIRIIYLKWKMEVSR